MSALCFSNGSLLVNHELQDPVPNSKPTWVPMVQVSPYPQAVSQATRPKQVTDPLNEVVRERLCGDQGMPNDCSSSGSEHEPDSASLADMVHGFMEDDEELCSHCNCLNGIGESCSESDQPEDRHLCQMLQSVVCCTNAVDLRLLGYSTSALEIAKENVRFSCQNADLHYSKSCLRRAVMMYFIAMGYNAGICKSRWEHIRDFPAGDYEYIDIIIEGRHGKKDRIFVDIDFRGQFEVARPTVQYSALVQLLPNIFIGRADRLQRIIHIMCDAAKRSLKKKTMHIPPWRKYRYMRAKWFGSYKRTTNPVSIPDRTRINSTLTHNMEQQCENPFRDANQAEAVAMTEREWKPPSVAFKSSQSGKSSGLASALTEAGLTSLSKLQAIKLL